MVRRLVLTGALAAFAVSAALAAPMPAKVIKIEKKEVRLILSAKPADWVKKGTSVRFLGTRGTILGVARDTVTVSSPNAAKAKVGDTVTLDKARASAAGC